MTFSWVATGAMREEDRAHHLLHPSPSLGMFAQQAGRGKMSQRRDDDMSYLRGTKDAFTGSTLLGLNALYFR